MKKRLWLLLGVLLAAVCFTFLLPPIPQSEAYHNFADQRTLLGIPNCLDVLSNIPFLMVGIWGILVVCSFAGGPSRFIHNRERWPYLVFFGGVALTTFGSSYYHLHPANDRLVWDRVPMTIGFMGLLSAVIAERISVRAGLRSLAPLLILGVGSVFYWRFTEQAGRGDLRPYALVQFGSLLAILLLIALFPPRYTRGADFIVSFGIYALAKLAEAADRAVFSRGYVVSGHTLKHVTAAISAYWILRMLEVRQPVERPARALPQMGSC